MIAYDNEKYYNLRSDEQRKMLIADVKNMELKLFMRIILIDLN